MNELFSFDNHNSLNQVITKNSKVYGNSLMNTIPVALINIAISNNPNERKKFFMNTNLKDKFSKSFSIDFFFQ
jgi:hypothetical protein